MKQRTLAVVSAGLSQPSSTRLLADRLAAATRGELERLGVSVDTNFVEVRDHAHDIMNNLLTGFPSAALRQAIDAVTNADGLIVVTPIFNASYSGLFKSFFDVLDDSALVGRPVLLAATGGSARHSLALEHAVRPMFSYLRALSVPTSVYAAPEDWAGAPGDAQASGALADRIRRAAAELAELVERHEPTKAADPFALTTTFEELLGGS
ncbi:MAG: FMN reductase [Hamadaea sp.]|uniref:FMN reductase n=1 Tax=Hamadaea sp. TaxID=2024425 RepID=UPI0017B0FF23|nr:FMN reductase [Hamadaea sp.]NUR69625.1 FMN reductase [Hamadaea sp.]NUT23331.1 FMN reductase [Hamadaea sp.]